jgi:hypothetical protein
VIDPDGMGHAEQAAYQRRAFSIVNQGDGTFRLRGRVDPEAAEIIRAALDPLAAPTPAADGTPDERTGRSATRTR